MLEKIIFYRMFKGNIWCKIEGKWNNYKSYKELEDLKIQYIEDYNCYKKIEDFDLTINVIYKFIKNYSDKYIPYYYNPFFKQWMKIPEIYNVYVLGDWSLNKRGSFGAYDLNYQQISYYDIKDFRTRYKTYEDLEKYFRSCDKKRDHWNNFEKKCESLDNTIY